MIADYLEKCLAKVKPAEEETKAVFDALLEGQLTEAQTAACLVGWRILGPKSDLLAIGARAMRQRAAKINLNSDGHPLVDNCGTGGDGSFSFNVSTASAIVAAACGVRIAKHGNRSVSSKCGSADLLFAAGFPDDLTAENSEVLFRDVGLTFLFAPAFHPSMKHVMPARRSLGIPTIFNLLGPLANPIRPTHQIVGVGKNEFIRPMAEALAKLGVERALVVHSRDGLDEISPDAPTDCIFVDGNLMQELVISPAQIGFHNFVAGLKGGNADENLLLLNKLLSGEKNAILSAVALNAGAAIWISRKVPDLITGSRLAEKAILSGVAKHYFERWIARAQQLSKGNQ